MRPKESAVVVMTDIHYGKKTTSFNPDACAEKISNFGDSVLRIHDLMTGYQFDELVVCLLGDINDGSEIYATQPHHQAITNVEQQAEDISTILADWFKRQVKSGAWPKIRVECVPGNHGRAGKHAHEAASWDIVTYKYLRNKLPSSCPLHLGKKNVFLRNIKIKRHNFLLYHGHEIKTFGNIPWYGMLLRTARWNLSSLSPFRAVLFGHWHTFGAWQFNQVTALASGTLITDDDWALQSLGWESANKWWMFGVSDKRPITWSFGLET
jgi:predicted phosphodiesterase